ncbi:hypothetical protein, partial [Salinimicrobium oceani]|uniref:hypothetical protein n=1 Tax=Salinimicrobium oceani TaxID=2722702 RepID=UPI001F327BF7
MGIFERPLSLRFSKKPVNDPVNGIGNLKRFYIKLNFSIRKNFDPVSRPRPQQRTFAIEILKQHVNLL